MQPGSKVRIAAPEHMLPQTLIRYAGRVGLLLRWEDEMAAVRFGNRIVMVAAGHLEGVG